MRRTRRLPYREGTWFAVPLKPAGFAVGIVARMSGNGVVFGYFFGPRRRKVPTYPEVEKLRRHDAVWCEMFGDLGLITNQWPIIGQSAEWDRKKWPLPVFGRIDQDADPPKAWKVIYDDHLQLAAERRCRPSAARRYPPDGLSGQAAVEAYLSDLLSR